VIHPTAVVGPDVELGPDVSIGPYVVIEGHTRIGARCAVHPFAALGGPPQDRSYRGEPTRLELGADTVVREHVSIHRGTIRGAGVTRIGARCYVMAGCHVGHDVELGDDVTLAGGTLLAGHVVLEDGVTTGGGAAFAQFSRAGTMAFVAAGAQVEHAAPPFHIAQGDRARVRALNEVGLERRDVAAASREALRRAHRMIYRSGRPLDLALSEVDCADPYVERLVRFLRTHICIAGPATR